MNTPSNPPAYSPEQMRERVYVHLAQLCHYWSTQTYGKTERERMEALCFSILVMLDGESAMLPAFTLMPRPHPDDKAYHMERGEQWWDEDLPVCTSHENWYTYLRGDKWEEIM